MDVLFEFLTYVGPTVAAILTVPILDGIKRLVGLVDQAPAMLKQLLAVAIAFGLTKLGSFLEVAIPTHLELFTGSDVEALVSAAIAMAIHAGKKASSGSSPAKLLILWLAFFPATAVGQRPGPITGLEVAQTGEGIVTARWDDQPDPIVFYVRWGPVGLHWGELYDPNGTGFLNQHVTDETAFVLSNVAVAQTGRVQVVAYDSTLAQADRYGPISEPVNFRVDEWNEPPPGPADTIAYPATTEAHFPRNADEFWLTMPDGRRMKMGRLWKWIDAGWFGTWGIWIGTEN